MRRIAAIFLALMLLVCLMAGAVSAQTGATSVNVYATVSSDGSCQVTVTALLHLEQPMAELYFPVPRDAESVTLNGSRVGTNRTSNARLVNLSDIAANVVGDFSVTLTYALRDLVAYNENDVLQLQLPLLSGFDYPVESLEYSVTMPGEIRTKPSFSSGYHQANIEKDLTSQVSGAMITGSATKALKDHETLTMTVNVTEEMFPQNRIELPDYDLTNTLMWVCFGLAILFWLIFLRCGLPRRMNTTAAPDGYSAGQMGSVLHMQGADLTLMVFSWAQLGYLDIVRGKHGRALLRKRMPMGNERSGFEQKCFANLFGRRNIVDTGELRYVQLWEQIAKMGPNIQSLIHPKSGSKKIFRLLSALIGLFGGAGIGIAIGTGAAAHWLWVIVFAILGFLFSWHIQRWAEGLIALYRRSLWISLILSAIWIVLGIIAGVFSIGFWTVIAQLLMGFLAAFGGRRTDAGMQVYSQALGLRRYLRRVSREDLQRISQNNPEYFFEMFPYAMALGVDKHFARHFGKLPMPPCPYMDPDSDVRLTAYGWRERLRQVAEHMDDRRKHMWRERLLSIFGSLKR